jgi:hypothetical protein
MNYFVTVDGIDVAANLNKLQAVERASKEYKISPEKGVLNVGIGKYKYNKGRRVYTLQPMWSYL